MKTYELTYIITPEISLEEAEAKAKEIEAAIQGKEGVILGQANPSAKTLSYPIKKHASGFLGVLEFQMESEKLVEFKENFSKDEKIARHMVTIKRPARIKKERRAKPKPAEFFAAEPKSEAQPKKEKEEGKVELKDIEQKLDEILGE